MNDDFPFTGPGNFDPDTAFGSNTTSLPASGGSNYFNEDVLKDNPYAKLPFLGGKADLSSFPALVIRLGNERMMDIMTPTPATAPFVVPNERDAAQMGSYQSPNPNDLGRSASASTSAKADLGASDTPEAKLAEAMAQLFTSTEMVDRLMEIMSPEMLTQMLSAIKKS